MFYQYAKLKRDPNLNDKRSILIFLKPNKLKILILKKDAKMAFIRKCLETIDK